MKKLSTKLKLLAFGTIVMPGVLLAVDDYQSAPYPNCASTSCWGDIYQNNTGSGPSLMTVEWCCDDPNYPNCGSASTSMPFDPNDTADIVVSCSGG